MSEQIDARDRWALEVAALLSQVPCVTLRPDTVERYCSGASLPQKEQAMIDKFPEVAEQLFKKHPAARAGARHPRRASNWFFRHSPAGKPRSPHRARVRHTLAKGATSDAAVQRLQRSGAHHPALLEAFARGEAGERESAAERRDRASRAQSRDGAGTRRLDARRNPGDPRRQRSDGRDAATLGELCRGCRPERAAHRRYPEAPRRSSLTPSGLRSGGTLARAC